MFLPAAQMSLATNFVCPSVCLSVGRSVGSVGFLSGYGSYVIRTEHLVSNHSDFELMFQEEDTKNNRSTKS